MRLSDRVIVVTGATGIAASGAQRFASEGASVVVLARNPDDSRELAEAVDGDFALADLRDEEATVKAFAEILDRHQRIDGLFAVAGGSGRKHGDGPLHEIPKSGWDATLDMNLTPPFLAARETLKAMLHAEQPTGSIVLITSVLALHPAPELFATHAYAAAKGAEVSMTKALAAYYAPQRIRVNAIAPSLVRTPMSERAFNDPVSSAYAASKQPLAAGFLMPDDVAELAVFLLGDESRHVTGQVIDVDGGWGVTEGKAP